jgi:hypothetical protein
MTQQGEHDMTIDLEDDRAVTFLTLRRIEEEIRRVCREHGYDGDPLAPNIPLVGDLLSEEAILNICLALPPDVKSSARELARRMVRCAVLSSSVESCVMVGDAPTTGSPLPVITRVVRPK